MASVGILAASRMEFRSGVGAGVKKDMRRDWRRWSGHCFRRRPCARTKGVIASHQHILAFGRRPSNCRGHVGAVVEQDATIASLARDKRDLAAATEIPSTWAISSVEYS